MAKTAKEKIETTCDLSLKPILTEEEACLFLGVSRAFLYNLRASGKIGFYREKRNKDKKILAIRYRRENLLEYIKENFEEVKPLKMAYL